MNCSAYIVSGPLRCVAALSALLGSAPCAASDGDLVSAETLSVTASFRLSTADGEKSWVDGGFGKLVNSGDAAQEPGTAIAASCCRSATSTSSGSRQV